MHCRAVITESEMRIEEDQYLLSTRKYRRTNEQQRVVESTSYLSVFQQVLAGLWSTEHLFGNLLRMLTQRSDDLLLALHSRARAGRRLDGGDGRLRLGLRERLCGWRVHAVLDAARCHLELHIVCFLARVVCK